MWRNPPCPPSPKQVLNPSETFGEIIVDYNHVECSSACITALTAFAQQYPEHRAAEIARAVKRGVSYIKRCGAVMQVLLVFWPASRGVLSADAGRGKGLERMGGASHLHG